MRKTYRSIFSVCWGANYLASSFVACKPAAPVNAEARGVATRAELSDCSEQNRWSVIFVGDVKKFFVCDGNNWVEVPVAEGPPGPTGQAGAAGAPGATGAAGAPGATGADGGGASAAVLSSLTPEAPGPRCPGGGQRFDAGFDTNDNTTLDQGEVTTTSYACNRARIVFTTTTPVRGDMRESGVSAGPTGLEGADAQCASTANASGVTLLANKQFQAWLSDANTSPRTRLAKDGAFVHVDGTLFAQSWDDLTSGNIKNGPVQQAVSGNTSAVWNNTTPEGALIDDASMDRCDEWTTSAFSNSTGLVSVVSNATSMLIPADTPTQNCFQEAVVLCIEE